MKKRMRERASRTHMAQAMANKQLEWDLLMKTQLYIMRYQPNWKFARIPMTQRLRHQAFGFMYR